MTRSSLISDMMQRLLAYGLSAILRILLYPTVKRSAQVQFTTIQYNCNTLFSCIAVVVRLLVRTAALQQNFCVMLL